MTFRRSLEMSLSREEFFRLLANAIRNFETDGEMIRWSDGDRAGTIQLIPLPDRRLGSVAVRRYSVEIALDASEAEGEDFMQRFHRAFLRGGG